MAHMLEVQAGTVESGFCPCTVTLLEGFRRGYKNSIVVTVTVRENDLR